MENKMLNEANAICLEPEPSKEWLISEIAKILYERADKIFVESMYLVLKDDIAIEELNYV